MTDSFISVIDNFKAQSSYCKTMGSPFYADLLLELAELLAQNSGNALGQVLSSWPGVPHQDAVALRFLAALHYLVIKQSDVDLQAIFPPTLRLVGNARKVALLRAIEQHQNFIIDYLKSPPQTNEVGRSMVLLGGFLEIAKRVGPQLDIFEIGASAGLNMAFDQYFYQTETWQWGEPSSKVHFTPNWTGNAPPLGPISVINRKACDLFPINASRQKIRLLSYVWPDQNERLQRINHAIDYAAKTKPLIEAAEASQWLLRQYREAPKNRPRVFYHSIIWQYFNDQQKSDFESIITNMGEASSSASPIIWMRLEPADNKPHAELKISIWPENIELTLANSGFHGEWIRWLGA